MVMPATLRDAVGLVDFNLVQGLDKTIRAEFSTDPDILDISGWTFELCFYIGTTLEKLTVLSSAGGGIVVNVVEKYIDLQFAAADIAVIDLGSHKWDLRYTAGTAGGQILKGQVTLSSV